MLVRNSNPSTRLAVQTLKLISLSWTWGSFFKNFLFPQTNKIDKEFCWILKYKDWKVGFGGCIGLIRKLWRWCKLSLIYSFNRRQLRPNKPLITYSYQSLKQTFRSCKIMMGIAVGPLYEFKYTKPKLCLKTEKYEFAM